MVLFQMYVDLLPFVRLNAINWLWICEIIDYSELAIKNYDLNQYSRYKSILNWFSSEITAGYAHQMNFCISMWRLFGYGFFV